MKYLLYLLVLICTLTGFTSASADLASDRARADAYMEANHYRQAFKAYRALARDGDHHAQYTVAVMYETGTGVRRNLGNAYAWASLAAEIGMPELEWYSRRVLAKIDEADRDQAAHAALKLQHRYGQAALRAKAERLAVGGQGRRFGSCTGSRLACENRVESVGIATAGGTAGVLEQPGRYVQH